MTKITEYTPIGRTPIDSDLMDISKDNGGGSFSTSSSTFSNMKGYFQSYAWYEESTVNPPTTISDDIYTGGSVGINKLNTDT
ncbi:unnamed protein product, partial [marine sediment metagenome]